MEDQQTLSNEVSDETGQFDPRFLLWRKFCDDHGVAVNSLPIRIAQLGDMIAAARKET